MKKLLLIVGVIAAASFWGIAPVHAANLVTNPCFTGGSTTGWSLASDYNVTSTNPFTGCGTGYTVNQNSANGFNNFAMSAGMTTVANATYTLQFWYTMNSSQPTHLQMNQYTEFGTNFFDIPVTSTAGVWTETQQTFNVGAVTTTWLRFYNNNGVVNANYDGFYFDLASATPPFFNNFSASPTGTQLGSPSTLSWNLSNASSVTITGNNLSLTTTTASGTISVIPNTVGTSTYTLLASNANGNATDTTTVYNWTGCYQTYAGRLCNAQARNALATARTTAQPVNNALNLTNGSGTYATIPHGSWMDGMGFLTVTAWVNLSASGQSNGIVDHNRFNSWSLHTNSGGLRFEGKVTGGGGEAVVANSSNTVPLSQWAQVGFTYSSSTGIAQTFINGVPDGTPTVVSGTINTDGSALVIGEYNALNGETNGQIDEVHIYNAALTNAQMLQDYNGIIPLPGSLLAQYQFNNISFNTIFDSGPNGYNGTDIGANLVTGYSTPLNLPRQWAL
jgi:hypothetical protein